MKRYLPSLLFLFVLFPSPVFADDFQDGVDALSRRDYTTAFNKFKSLAEQGHAKAQYYVGDMYRWGKRRMGVTKDLNETLKWYKLSADQGFARAQTALGNLYERGDGVELNYDEAEKWYRLAADQGYASAQFSMGKIYQTTDREEADKWFMKAAKQGYKRAQNFLSEGKWEKAQKEMEKNEKILSADQGDASDQYDLGIKYLWGSGVSQDKEEAVKWLKLATKQGHAEAKYFLEKIIPFHEDPSNGGGERSYGLKKQGYKRWDIIGPLYAKDLENVAYQGYENLYYFARLAGQLFGQCSKLLKKNTLEILKDYVLAGDPKARDKGFAQSDKLIYVGLGPRLRCEMKSVPKYFGGPMETKTICPSQNDYANEKEMLNAFFEHRNAFEDMETFQREMIKPSESSCDNEGVKLLTLNLIEFAEKQPFGPIQLSAEAEALARNSPQFRHRYSDWDRKAGRTDKILSEFNQIHRQNNNPN
jgi:TPR repeat protein